MRELIAARDAMPVKRLARNSLASADGGYCALGAVGAARGMDLTGLDDGYDHDAVAKAFGIAPSMVREITFENDDVISLGESSEKRWWRMRNWAQEQLCIGRGETDRGGDS